MNVGEFEEIAIKTFNEDQEWVDVNFTINPDATISIQNPVLGPTAVFCK